MLTKTGHLIASLKSSRTHGRPLVFVLCALVFSVVIFHTFSLPSSRTTGGDSAHISSHSQLPTPTPSTPTPSAPTPTAKNRHGIVAFLAADFREEDDSPDDDDKYFVSTRMLVYQLLHAPSTKISQSISFTILVTKEVRESKIQRLRKDGATVVVVDGVDHDGVEIKNPRWQQMFTKLRAFDPELLPFEKVLAIDTDVILTRPIDAIFSDITVEPSPVDYERALLPAINSTLPELSELPATFAFAATPETNDLEHDYPFRDPEHQKNYFNGACLLFAPSPRIYRYILSSVKRPDLYSHTFAEQDLLNFVFKRDGPMPWRRLTHSWFINWPNKRDIDGGMAIIHSKFWDNGELPFREGEMLAHAKRWEMQGYWAGKERF